MTEYFTAPWEIRVGLARQLLDAAFLLSGQNELGVALYLTDWFEIPLPPKKNIDAQSSFRSPDNFAVSLVDGRVRVVDAEDAVLVDVGLVKEQRGPGWDVPHTAGGEAEDCKRNFCYSAADLCKR